MGFLLKITKYEELEVIEKDEIEFTNETRVSKYINKYMMDNGLGMDKSTRSCTSIRLSNYAQTKATYFTVYKTLNALGFQKKYLGIV